jgi:UDP-glucose 4-epimerase
MTRVVVLGATGNIGSSVVRALLDESDVDHVVTVARRPPAAPPARTTHHCADIGTDDVTPLLDGADALIHLAWQFHPMRRPLTTWRSNVLGSMKVFDAVAAAGVPTLIHTSSIGAYSPGPEDGRPVDETWPTHSVPTSAYGREKAYLERALDTFEAQHPGTRVVRFRPAFVFQRAAATEQRRIFAGPLLPNRLVRRIPLVPYPSGLRLQAVHADDLAQAYVRALSRPVRGAFNLAADPVLDGPSLATVVGGRGIATPPAVLRAGLSVAWAAHLVPTDPTLLDLALRLPTMDSTRARSELEWRPRRSAVAAVAEMIEGVAAGSGGPTPPLAPDCAEQRLEELRSGVGQRA